MDLPLDAQRHQLLLTGRATGISRNTAVVLRPIANPKCAELAPK